LDVLTNDIYTIIRRNTTTTISHEMVARFTGKYESSMSLSFEAVIWSIHDKLNRADPEDKLWWSIHNVVELTLPSPRQVCQVFTAGRLNEDGIIIRINRRTDTCRQLGDPRYRENSELEKETWTLTLETSTEKGYKKISDYVSKCIDVYKHKLKLKKAQTLYEASHMTTYGDDPSMVYNEHPFTTTKNFDNLFFPRKSELLRKLDMFENHEDQYARLGKPYKFYMMFHGEHGCAKTSVIKAIASKTGKHVVVLRLDRFKDVVELCQTISDFATQEKMDYKDCMFVVEEFDCFNHEYITRDSKESEISSEKTSSVVVVESGKNVATVDNKKPEVKKSALGTLLNTFDGVRELHGCMVIFTTNKPDSFDPALVRPGRIELMHFGRLNAYEIGEYWRLTYESSMPLDVMDALSKKEEIVTLADLSIVLEQNEVSAGRELLDLVKNE
jgi:hypothetical protein